MIKGRPWLRADEQLGYRILPPAGTLLKVQDMKGDFLGWAVSEGPNRLPAFRVVSRERRADLGSEWWAAHLERAVSARRALQLGSGPRCLINAEADGLPGLTLDEAGGQHFISYSSPGIAAFADVIEAAWLSQQRPKGLWRREGAPGAWGPWSRSPLMPASPGRLRLAEGPLSLDLDLDKDAALGIPAWPLERRAVRQWLAEASAGQRVLLLGAQAGEAETAQAAGARTLSAPSGSLFKALPKAPKLGADVVLVDVPASSKESFGRFEPRRQGSRLLSDLADATAPGGQILLSSAHPDLQHAGPWERLWADSGLEPVPALERVLGPEPDLPEVPAWPEGRQPRAYLFRLPGSVR
jgi:23S rRNA G2069 N7-methylase RlmK/C1962 C5-methylase RlmI